MLSLVLRARARGAVPSEVWPQPAGVCLQSVCPDLGSSDANFYEIVALAGKKHLQLFSASFKAQRRALDVPQ